MNDLEVNLSFSGLTLKVNPLTFFMKSLQFIFIIFLSLGCSPDEQDTFLIKCPIQSISPQSYNVKRGLLKPIPILPKHYKKNARYDVSVIDGDYHLIETSLDHNKFTVFNMSKGTILTHDSLKTPPIKTGIASFKNLDSIYFQIPERSRIYRFNSTGAIKEIIDLSKYRPHWMLPDSPVSLLSDLYQGKIEFIDKHQMRFVLNAFDFWYYKNKPEIGLVAELDLSEDTLYGDFSNISNYLTESPISLPDRLTYPYFVSKKNDLIISYPFDHNIYLYDMSTRNLVESTCMSSEYISALEKPLSLNFDTQESINLQISTPYYGQVNYHENIKLFSRLVFHGNDLYDMDGKLNLSSCEREYSLILFDNKLNKIDEIFLGNSDLWETAIPTSNGFLVVGKCENYAGEDFLRVNVEYEIYN